MFTATLALLSAVTLQVDLQPWTRSCKETAPDAPLSCGIPTAAGAAMSLSASVELAANPSEARVSKLSFANEELGGEIRFYSAYPATTSGLPPYIQIQIETFRPVRSLCLQSVRLRSPFEASPLSCTAFDSASGQQLGLNVKVSEASSASSSNSALQP
jgi:hypothetical protein